MATDWITQHLLDVNDRRTLTIASDANPTVNVDQYSALEITALAADITAIDVTGTPSHLQELVVRIKDNSTVRALAFGSDFEPVGAALPTTTVDDKRTTVTFLYDANTSKFGSIAAVVEA